MHAGKEPEVRLPDALLIETEWIRALARSLGVDAHQAEDLVQDTWVSALERRPDPRRSVRSWIATLLRRRVGKLRRADASRRSRERDWAPMEATDSTLDVLERTSTHRDLVEAVLALAEPYRGTLLLRYFDELSYDEIAERTNATTATVNSRITRGLELLRRKLDGRYGSRRAWIVLFHPLTQTAKGAASVGTGMLHLNTTAQVSLVSVAAATVLVSTSGPLSPAHVPPEPPPMHGEVNASMQDDDTRWETTVSSRFALEGAVEQLVLRTSAGAITLIEGEGAELSVEARVIADTEKVDASQRTEEFSDHVHVAGDGGQLVIEDAHSVEGAESDGWSVSLTIRTPRAFPVSATTGAGSISISSARERVELETGAGGIRLDLPEATLKSIAATTSAGSIELEVGGIEASASAETSAGDVHCHVRGASQPESVSLATSAGGITFVAPQQVSGQFRMETSTGSISVPESLGLEVVRQGHVGASASGQVGSASTSYEFTCSTGSIHVELE